MCKYVHILYMCIYVDVCVTQCIYIHWTICTYIYIYIYIYIYVFPKVPFPLAIEEALQALLAVDPCRAGW